jgi:hypothetical protein
MAPGRHGGSDHRRTGQWATLPPTNSGSSFMHACSRIKSIHRY